jgi:hypothetical protein
MKEKQEVLQGTLALSIERNGVMLNGTNYLGTPGSPKFRTIARA